MLKENTSPELQLLLQFLPSNHMLSNSINHFGENTSPNGYLISECRNHAKENTCPELKLLPQLPANDYLISESRNHVEENSSLELQLLLQFLPSNYTISESSNHVEEKKLPKNCSYCHSFYQITIRFLILEILLKEYFSRTIRMAIK